MQCLQCALAVRDVLDDAATRSSNPAVSMTESLSPRSSAPIRQAGGFCTRMQTYPIEFLGRNLSGLIASSGWMLAIHGGLLASDCHHIDPNRLIRRTDVQEMMTGSVHEKDTS